MQKGSWKGGNWEPFCFLENTNWTNYAPNALCLCLFHFQGPRKQALIFSVARENTPTAPKNNILAAGGLFGRAKEDCYISPRSSLLHLFFPCSLLLPLLPSPVFIVSPPALVCF